MRTGAGCACVAVCFLLSSCTPPEPRARLPIDGRIASEIARIKAIDNHAHPGRLLNQGESDPDVDALPVEMMEPYDSLPARLRPESFQQARQAMQGKTQAMRDQGDAYPAWVLDRLGIDIMMANRVSMGRGLANSRFKWIPFADPFMYPLNNDALAAHDPDRKAFFTAEAKLLDRYLAETGTAARPTALPAYQAAITSSLERWKAAGAVGVKFEMAYLRSLKVERVSEEDAKRAFSGAGDYRALQDYLFRFIAAECGRLKLPIQIHTGMGAGRYYNTTGGNPANLIEIVTDPSLKSTQFILVHGGWPFAEEASAMLAIPNVWLDFSIQTLFHPPRKLSQIVRQYVSYVPEKVLFGTDSGPFGEGIGWEETGWASANTARQSLGLALSDMVRDGEITRDRALHIVHMVMRDNARRLYGLP